MVKCFCVDDSKKPDEIPAANWVAMGEPYRITEVALCLPQKVLGFSLYEKPLGESCKPWEYFTSNRFVIPEDQLFYFFELCDNCKELDGLNINELMKQSNLQVV